MQLLFSSWEGLRAPALAIHCVKHGGGALCQHEGCGKAAQGDRDEPRKTETRTNKDRPGQTRRPSAHRFSPPSDYRVDTIMPTDSTTRPLTTNNGYNWIPRQQKPASASRQGTETRTNEDRRGQAIREERRPASPQVSQPVRATGYGHLVGVNDKTERPTGPNKAPVVHRQPQPSYSYRKGRSLPISQPNVKNRGSTQNPAPRNRLPTQATNTIPQPLDWGIGIDLYDWSQNCQSITNSKLQESCIQHFAKRRLSPQ